MFSLGTWGEILIIAVVALVVVGPKDLPYALSKVGRLVGRLRKFNQEVQLHFNELIQEAERSEIKSSIESASEQNESSKAKKTR